MASSFGKSKPPIQIGPSASDILRMYQDEDASSDYQIRRIKRDALDQLTMNWLLMNPITAKNMSGWAEGRGIAFESDFTLAPADKATLLRFTDHAKAPAEARLSREGEKLALTLGDRRLRLMKSPTTRVGK